MPIIKLQTTINAPLKRCFDVARDIDIHMASTKHTGEQAVAGKKSGLINLDESVTWRAKHFGIWQNLTSKITAMEEPRFFVDEMVEGAFKSFRHEHHFEATTTATLMSDIFIFEAPLGILGWLANFLFLKKYMRKLLMTRNEVIKQYAEGELT